MVKKIEEPKKPAESETPAEPEEPRVVIHLRPGNFISGIPMRDLTASEWMALEPALRADALKLRLYDVPADVMKEDEWRMTNE